MPKKPEIRVKYDQPKAHWYFKIGQQYYRRIMPTPWAFKPPEFEKLKALLTDKTV